MKNAKEIYMYLLGAFIVGASATVIVMLISKSLPENNKDIVNIALGSMLTMAGSVVSYFFGSSKGSSDKNEILKTNATEAPVVDFSDTRIAQLVYLGWKSVANGYELNGNIITNEQLKTLSVSEFNALIK